MRPRGKPLSARQHAQRCIAALAPRPAMRPRRWKGAELERLRVACTSWRALADIAADFQTAPNTLRRLADIHGWPRRQPKGGKHGTTQEQGIEGAAGR